MGLSLFRASADTGAQQAVRLDAAGFRETVEFFGPADEKLSGATSVPDTGAGGGVVVCPSICVDFLRNYRREVVLARQLAGRGIATQRFSYRGTGNSDGEAHDLTYEAMVWDAGTALARLRDLVDSARVAFVGTRIGALVAAAAAATQPDAPVVLIDPTLDPTRFFREGFRARMAHEVKEQDADHLTTKDLIAELSERGTVDVLGQSIDRALYETLTPRSLVDELGDQPRPVLLVQLGGSEVRREYADLAAALTDRGWPVDVELVGAVTSYWFLSEDALPSHEVAGVIVDWLAEQLAVTA